MADVEVIYLDYNCFQRGFDDPNQARIQMESIACEEVFARAEAGSATLVWSFMHQDETVLCPFPERKQEVLRLSALCSVRVGPSDAIRSEALSFQQRAGVSAKDALHLACAVESGAKFFLTCDDPLARQARRAGLATAILNPVEYVRRKGMDTDGSSDE